MEIRIFGPGCARCTETEHLIREIAAARGGDITVQKVSDFREMMKVSDFREMMAAGILSTPAVAINGVVKAAGRVPGRAEMAAWIDDAAGPASARGENCRSMPEPECSRSRTE